MLNHKGRLLVAVMTEQMNLLMKGSAAVREVCRDVIEQVKDTM